MTDKLPPNLLALFAPRPALRYLPAADHPPEDRRTHKISGVAQFLPQLKEDFGDYTPTETWYSKKINARLGKQESHKHLVTEGFKNDYKPRDDPNIKGDVYKTLFVARLAYGVEKEDLEMIFKQYGPVESIRIVEDLKAKADDPIKKKRRGYAFVVYKSERDMKDAYKQTDGMVIKGRKILVDVERGRIVSDWRPRRFGGGLGGRGYTKAVRPAPAFTGGPPSGPGGFGGGFRGGFRGGFSDRGGGFRGRGGGFSGGGYRGGGGGGGGYRGGYNNDRGSYGGGRGGIGFQGGGGFGGPPDGAPAGPRGGGGGGYGSRPSYGDRNGNGYAGRNEDPDSRDRKVVKQEYIKQESSPEPSQRYRGGGSYRDRDAGGYSGGGSYSNDRTDRDRSDRNDRKRPSDSHDQPYIKRERRY